MSLPAFKFEMPADARAALPNPGRWFACQQCGHWTELTQNGLALKCEREQREGRRHGVICDGCLFRMFVEGEP